MIATVLKTVNSGNTWSYLSTGITSSLSSIYFINDTIGFACGGDTILKTTNGGTSWTSQSPVSGFGLNKIFFSSDSVGYCKFLGCGTNLIIYKTVDQGNTWSLQSTIANTMCFSSMFFTNNDTGYVAGQFNLSKTTDGGITWNPQTASPPGQPYFWDDLRDVHFLNNDTGFAVGNNQFYRTKAGGLASVNDQNSGNNKNNLSIYPNPTSDQFFIDANATEILSVNLYDINGRCVLSTNVNNKSNINVATLNEGVYSVVTKTADRVINEKLVIIR